MRRFYIDSFLFAFFLAFEYQQPEPPPPEYIPNVDKEPVLLKKVDAVFPLYALQEKCEGEVMLAILVKTDGSVEDVKIVKSHDEIFNEVATKAAMQWVFKPAIFNKNPIKFWYNVTMVFTLIGTDSLGTNIQPEILVLGDSSSVLIILRDSTSSHIVSQESRAEKIKGVGYSDFTPQFGESQVVDKNPVLIQKIEAKYLPVNPNLTKGTAVFSLLVDTDGRVRDVKILRTSYWDFIGATIVAVRQWIFKPAYKNGNPVKFWYTDSLDFRIK